MEAAPAKMITLKSSDEQIFLFDVTTITSNILAKMTTIPGNILAKVIDYCNKHAEVATSDEDKKIWDEQFLNLDFGTNAQIFLDMMQVAEFLNIQGLMDLISNKMAKWMTGKPLEDIRQAFNLTDEEFQITPEKDEEINRRLEFLSRRRMLGL
ncbi:SKP1-like protein 1B [Papaver somniferum]|uniref:SKP1-like protein 1B n=1 Tax=Papaver somniferum TaxID=3469 RepID=UPI000E6FF7A9|nr:SKP1-like protein 1B [Papaver somniferum]